MNGSAPRTLRTLCTRSATRSLHAQAKPLTSLRAGAPLDGLLSPQGLNNAYYARHDAYSHRLQQLAAHNPELQEAALDRIVADNARSPAKRDLLASASMLYNLQFAYASLKGTANATAPQRSSRDALLRTPDTAVAFANEPAAQGAHRLQEELAASFRSLVEFRTLLLGSAAAIEGDGYTWLLARKYATPYGGSSGAATDSGSANLYDRLFVMNTYNAGSPFNFNSAGMLDALRGKGAEPLSDVERARATATDSSTVYIPLLAIDASPKAWLGDYGVYGKQAYLERVWQAVDWRVVEDRMPKKSPVVYA